LDFDVFFAADQPVERVEFTVGGKPHWFDLKPMNQAARARWEALGIKLMRAIEKGEPDMTAVQNALIESTVVGYSLVFRRKVHGTEEWIDQPEEAPLVESARNSALREKVLPLLTPAAYEWLAEQCQRVNGLLGADPKN
jgi:hypothetical protein